jgi:glycosyltransferase involved in cell wall biosynthesis
MNHLVSICIPTYNGTVFIAEAMDSAIAQTYENLEIIVSDDSSEDETLKIIESYKQKTNIPIYINNHQPTGIGANWNNSIKKANGEYIKFLFQDDVLSPNCIQEMVDVFLQNSNLGLVACKRDFIIEDGQSLEIEDWINKFKNLQVQFQKNEEITIIDKTLFSRRDFLDSPMNKIGEPPTVLFRKEIIQEIGFFDEELKQILDYVFYYRILKKYPIAIINKPLVKFRIHEAQATNVNRDQPILDYQLYDRILYKEFYNLLHPSIQLKLAKKYSIFTKLKTRVTRVYKKIRGKIGNYYRHL